MVYDLVVEYFGADFLCYNVFMAMHSILPRKSPLPLKVFKKRDWKIQRCDRKCLGKAHAQLPPFVKKPVNFAADLHLHCNSNELVRAFEK